MRGKEEAHDYRYFPDPDLLPLVIDDAWIREIQGRLPELPDARKSRFVSEFGLPEYDAQVLTASRETADYFEACVAAGVPAKAVSNWVMGPLLGLLNAEGRGIEDTPVSARHLAELIGLIEDGTISGKIAKAVFEEMAKTGEAPGAIVEEKGLVQVTDTDALETAVETVLDRCPAEVEAYRGGKTKLIGFFVGQVMKETQGKANPKAVNDILKKKLK
jgi:aspartyl-tRNA(Asn)/glutamyl-tRNA(Gln) amidotransferase subunit B